MTKRKPGSKPDDGLNEEGPEEAAFPEELLEALHSWDARIVPKTPHLLELQQLIARQKETASRRLWRALWKLWLLGLLLIGGMLALLHWNTIAFVLLQLAIAVGAVGFVALLARRDREGTKKWTA